MLRPPHDVYPYLESGECRPSQRIIRSSPIEQEIRGRVLTNKNNGTVSNASNYVIQVAHTWADDISAKLTLLSSYLYQFPSSTFLHTAV